MPDQEKSIAELIDGLPAEYQEAARKYIETLSSKAQRQGSRFLKQDWAGALTGFRDQYTSQVLQKKALDWRNK